MTYAQSIVKLEDIRLPGLDGMLPGAKVKGREKAVLEYLVEAEKVIREEYLDQLKGRDRQIIKTYFQIYEKLKTDLLRDVDFSDRDILTYIDYRVETEGQFKTEETNKLDDIFGLYTGCLLSLLTERNEEAGLSTSIYFDGKGRTIPYLFYCAHKVDELIINNVLSLTTDDIDGMCSGIGGLRGYANFVMIVNSKGANCHAGFNGGKVGVLSLINHFDEPVVSDFGFAGGVAREGGNADMLLLSNCVSPDIIPDLAREGGSLGMVIATDIICDSLAKNIGRYQSNVGLAVMDDIVNCNRFTIEYHDIEHFSKADVKKLLISGFPGVPDVSKEADEVILKEQSPERWAEVAQEYNVEQLIRQMRSITKESTKEEILEVASQIKAIYKLTKPKLDKLLEK